MINKSKEQLKIAQLEKLNEGSYRDRHDDLRDELKTYYVNWRSMFIVIGLVCGLYAYVTPRVIAYETSNINQKLDQIIIQLNKK